MENTTRKIVAIGGGENGRITRSGVKMPYELTEIDREIIRLSGKEKPHFLMLAHAQITFGAELEQRYSETMQRVYDDLYGCEFRFLKASDLEDDPEKARQYVEWADIIYEGGGDTVALIGLWQKTGFDKTLKSAWEAGKVMCGVSAGAICWFSSGNTAHPDYKDREVNEIPGLGFVDAYFSPHCQYEWKRKSEINSLRHINKVGLSVSNCCALEIVGDTYRVLKSTPADGKFRPYALRTYRKGVVLYEERLQPTDEFKPLGELLSAAE